MPIMPMCMSIFCVMVSSILDTNEVACSSNLDMVINRVIIGEIFQMLY